MAKAAARIPQHHFNVRRRQNGSFDTSNNSGTSIPHADDDDDIINSNNHADDYRLLNNNKGEHHPHRDSGRILLRVNFPGSSRWKLFRAGLLLVMLPLVAWNLIPGEPSATSSHRKNVSFSKSYNSNNNDIYTATAREKLPRGKPRYGVIDYKPLPKSRFARTVDYAYDYARYGKMRNEMLFEMDDQTTSEDVDKGDDNRRYGPFDEQKVPSKDGCYRLKWTYEVAKYGSCNEFHSLSFGRMLTSEMEKDEKRHIKYLGRGSYRETWMLTDSDGEDDCVLKTNRYAPHRNYKNYAYSQTQNEALVMLETHSSDRTMSIYGYCGSSLLVEPGDEIEDWLVPNDWEYMAQEELDKLQVDDVAPQNSLTLEEKLHVAIVMSETIALLHGHPEGAIVSHDIGFDQWLRSKKDGKIKLSDSNKARAMYWNPAENRYCKFYSHQVSSYRAPEEMHGGLIDDTADMVALGKFIYTLVTGLRAYYEKMSKRKAVKAAFEGELPYIDPRYRTRSYIEGRLVEIMERCWPTNATERVDIFTVVSHLRETARLANSTAS